MCQIFINADPQLYASRSRSIALCSKSIRQPQTAQRAFINLFQCRFIHCTNKIPQSCFVYCPYLFQQHNRILRQALHLNMHMSNKMLVPMQIACQRRYNHRRRISVSNIILQNYNRTYSVLF